MRLCSSIQKFWDKPDCVFNRSFRQQLFATLVVNIIAFSHGISIGWLSPTLTKLQSDNSPLGFAVSIEQASWIGSLIGIGSLCGNFVFGMLLELLGRKLCIYMIALPHMMVWILIYCASSVEFLYVARVLGGFTGGSCYVILPIFIAEIADISIRGTLFTILMLSVNFGILTGFILSSHLGYHVVPCITVALPVVYAAGMTFFPETPRHLLRRGNPAAAEQSFKFYNNCELQKFNESFQSLKASLTTGNTATKITCSDFLNKTALQAALTALVLLCVNQFSGLFAFVNYMSHIFSASGSLMDPNTSTIIMGVVQIFGVYSATVFADRCGRKLLILMSAGGVAVGVLAMGFYTFYSSAGEGNTWIPLLLMTIIVYLGNMGIVALTFVVLVELFPAKIRSIASSTCMMVLSVLVFIMLKFFPTYMQTFGISVAMWSCGTVTAVGFVYLACFLPETKGKSLDE